MTKIKDMKTEMRAETSSVYTENPRQFTPTTTGSRTLIRNGQVVNLNQTALQ